MASEELRTTSRGRPPLDREKVRRNRVVTFLTDGELEMLRKLAEAEKETLSGACYRLLKNRLSIGEEPNEKQ